MQLFHDVAEGDELRARAKRFAFATINLVSGLPHNIATDAIARQLIKAGTSVCANHRAAGRARSRREFVAKLGLVVEEADEAELWLEALLKCRLAPASAVQPMYLEACELRAIFVKSLQTARKHALLRAAAAPLVLLLAAYFLSFLVS